MKKHLFGTLIFSAAFFLGFLVSPVRLTVLESGCAGSATLTFYRSNYFEKIESLSAKYQEQEELDKAFTEQINFYLEDFKNPQILEIAENRVFITFQIDNVGQRYCVIKKINKSLSNVCSASLWHVREFEKQKVSKH